MNWKEKINRKYMQISLYVIITVVIIYSLSLIVKNAPGILHYIVDKLNWVLAVVKPVIIGFIFAYILDPLVAFFERRYKNLRDVKPFRKIVSPRIWAAFTSVFVLFIAVAGLVSILIFTVTDQIKLANLDDITKLVDVYMNNIKGFYESIIGKLDQLNIQSEEFSQYVKSVANYITNALMTFATNTVDSIKNISSYLTTIIFSFIIGFYFLIDGRMFMNYTKKVSNAIFNENANRRMQGIIHDLDEVFSAYIRGQLTDALVMMFLISIVLSIVGVKFAIVIGIFAGIGNLIPYFGPIVAYISTSLVCLMNGDFKTWIIAMVALFLVQFIDGNVIGPKLLSQSIKIHPLIIIVSIIFGSAFGGFLGMLLAVPVGAYIKLVFVRFVDRRLEWKKETNH